MSSYGGGIGFLAGFVVGALAGGVAALLLAPQSGEDTREALLDRGIEIKARAGEIGTQARDTADQLRTQIAEAVQEGIEAANKTKTELMSRFESEAEATKSEV